MLGAFPEMAKGYHMMDAIVILASIDIVLGEVDR
jgi:NADH-quinone oxidoreductase subunit D